MADAVCHGDTEGVQISRDILHTVKPIRCSRNRSWNLDAAIL